MTTKLFPALTRSQRDALLYVAMRGAPELRELRATGFNKGVIDRLCGIGLTFWGSWRGNDDDTLVKTTDAGTVVADRYYEWRDDPRLWWLVSSSAVGRPMLYQAPTARSAVAALRRDLVDAERANGQALAAAETFIGLHAFAAEGPYSTTEARDLDFGWELGEAICRINLADRAEPTGPAPVHEARRFLPEEQIEHLREQIHARYSAPA